MATLKRTYRDANGALQTGSIIGRMKWDGTGRRIEKQVGDGNASSHEIGDWEGTYRYYHDGDRIVEVQNGSDKVLKQHVWGTEYVDDLVQVAVNADPADQGESDCENLYWAAHDANYNVRALLAYTGSESLLKERYEYTPYGERQAYKKPGSNDTSCRAAIGEPQRALTNYPHSLNDIGHQGLLFDKEFGLYYNRARMYHPGLMRFMQRDPLGYVDGGSLYERVRNGPLNGLDPRGLKTIQDYLDQVRNLEELRFNEMGAGSEDMDASGISVKKFVRAKSVWAEYSNPRLHKLARRQDAAKAKIQDIINRAAFLGVDPVGLDDESQEWEDSTTPYKMYLLEGAAQGGANGLADTAYQLVTLGFADGRWLPFGGKDNPAHQWGYVPGRLLGEAATVAIPSKYLGYAGKGAKAIRIAVSGVRAADKIQNVVIIGSMGKDVAQDLINGKIDSSTIYTAVLVAGTVYIMRASLADDARDIVRFTKKMHSTSEVMTRGRGIREVRELVDEFGGTVKGWTKKKCFDELGREFHYYEHHGIGRRKLKLK